MSEPMPKCDHEAAKRYAEYYSTGLYQSWGGEHTNLARCYLDAMSRTAAPEGLRGYLEAVADAMDRDETAKLLYGEDVATAIRQAAALAPAPGEK